MVTWHYHFWAWDEAECHGGSTWWNKLAYFLVAEKQREREKRERERESWHPNVSFKDAPLMT
jgi:hypothetical protein